MWEDVLRDYTSGTVVALAPNLESALEAVEQIGTVYEALPRPTHVIDVNKHTRPIAFAVHGGG